MQLTVLGEATAAFAPQRATVHLQLGFEGPDKERALARTTELAVEFAAAIDRLRQQQPAPITWSAMLPIGTRSWRPYAQDGTIKPLRHGASCRVEIKFCDFRALSAFIDAWGGRDGVSVGHVEWTLTEANRIHEEGQVLARAVEAARQRAQTMATAAGAGAVRFVELADPGLLAAGLQAEAVGYAKMARGAAHDGEGANIVPEDVELAASVHARFSAEA